MNRLALTVRRRVGAAAGAAVRATAQAWRVARRSGGMAEDAAARTAEDAAIRGSRTIRTTGLCLIIITILLAVMAIRDVRDRTEETYRRDIAALGIVLAEQTSRYIQEIDIVLRGIQQHCAELGIRTPSQFHDWLDTDGARTYLKENLRNMAQVDALIGIDASGTVVNSTRATHGPRLNVADRDYFRHFASENDPHLYIGAPVVSRLTGKPAVYAARGVNAPDGSFLGVVEGAVDIEYLVDFYRSISTRPGQSVTLLRRDGLTLIRYPDPTGDVGKWMPKQSPWYQLVADGGGRYSSPGFLGGPIPALVTVHPLKTFPLVIDVSIKEYFALAAWRHQATMLGLAGLAATVGFALLFWMIFVLFRRQETQNVALHRTTDALRQSESRLSQESHLLQMTLENMDQGLVMVGKDQTVQICNRRAIELLDLPPALMARHPAWGEVIDHQWQAGEFPGADAAFHDRIRQTLIIDGQTVYDRERPNGRVIEVRTTPLPDGEAVRTYTDITDRTLAERRIEFMAHHDSLTGLANRVLLHDRLSMAMAQWKRSGTPVAVLAIDLDRFKMINDTYGHEAGDHVLKQTASRLAATVRLSDTVARVGGDEFLVVQTDRLQPAAALVLARRLIVAVTQPVAVAGRQITLGASVGIALFPADGTAVTDLLKAADAALYRAKKDGRGVARMFASDTDPRVSEDGDTWPHERHTVDADASEPR